MNLQSLKNIHANAEGVRELEPKVIVLGECSVKETLKESACCHLNRYRQMGTTPFAREDHGTTG